MNISAITKLKIVISVAVLMNALIWFYARDIQPRWLNVPPAPTMLGATLPALGDTQFAYRLIGLSLQNMGDTGGRVIALKDYNYDELSKWLSLEHKLDPKSNHIPTLAGFVFGGSQNPEKLRPLIEYLRIAGQVDQPDKWRWLVQAVFLARHKLKDMDLALDLAKELADLYKPGMPAFVLQMPAFVMTNKGEKEAALELMYNIMESQGENLHPNEVNSIKAYICEQIFDPDEAARYDLCQEI